MRRFHSSSALAALATGCLLASISTRLPAQAARADAAPVVLAEESQSVLQVYFLRHAVAAEVSDTLRSLAPGGEDFVCTADRRTNSILLLTEPSTHAEVKKMLEVLDVETQAKPPSPKVAARIYRFKFLEADKDTAKILQLALGDGAEFAHVPTQNAFVLRGDPTMHAAMGELLASLDQPAAKTSQPTRRVRIVWLAEPDKRREEPVDKPVPADLASVSTSLEKVGVTGLRLAAQVIIQTDEGGRFVLESGPSLNGDSVEFTSTGQLISRGPGDLALDIELDCSHKHGEKITSLKTKVRAPIGHPVVLCVAPTGNLQMAFVVQVLED